MFGMQWERERDSRACVFQTVSYADIDPTRIPFTAPLIGPRSEQLDLTSQGMGEDY